MLDPRGFLFATTDGQGRFSFTRPVDPGFEGLTFYFQAFGFAPGSGIWGTDIAALTVRTQSTMLECQDGLDNDGDGLIDGNDFDCFGPNGQESDADYGWTLLEPAAGTQIIYVSSSLGNDGNDGRSPEQAVATIQRGKDLLRDGHPDWLLLKRGDTWNSGMGIWNKSGMSRNLPMVIGSYGASTIRPLLNHQSSNGIGGESTPIHHIRLVGIHFRGNYDSQSISVRLVGPGSDFLVEDCEFESNGGSGIVVQQCCGREAFDDFRMRRSLSHSAKRQGIYTSDLQQLLIEENIFYHNGWRNPDRSDANIFDHNMYIQSTNSDQVVVQDNIVLDASSHGIQLRSGGFIRNNLFVRNPLAILLGGGTVPIAGGTTGEITGNVILESGDINANLPRGFGIGLFNIGSAAGGALVENNIIANDSSCCPHGYAFKIDSGPCNSATGYCPAEDIRIRNNIVYRHRRGLQPSGATSGELQGILFENNEIQLTGQDVEVVRDDNAYDPTGFTYRGNIYDSAASSWFIVNQQGMSLAAWQALTGDDSTAQSLNYRDPGRNLGTYAQHLGLGSAYEDFVAELLQQSKRYWRTELTAPQANAYFREGFERIP